MATGIIVPARRLIKQPQYVTPIDSAGLGKGAQMLFNPAFGPIDLATGRVWEIANATVTGSQYGRAFNFDGSNDYLAYSGYQELTGNTGTYFMWCPRVGAASSFGHVFFASSSPNVSGHQVNENGFIIIGTGSGASSGSISWFNTINRSLVLVSNGTAAGTKAYVDGVDTGFTWASPPTAFGTGDKLFRIGMYAAGNAWDVDASMLSIGMTSALWSAAEAKAYHDSKGNALFKSPTRRIWVSAAAGGTAYTQSISGSLTPAGALAKRTGKALSGSSTATGALTKQTGKALAGSSTPVGALTRLTLKGIGGFLSMSGGLVKKTFKTYTGSITGSGALATMILFTASFAGSITPSGALSKMTLKALAGASTLTGAITKLTAKGLSASITLSGALNKLTTKAFAGSITVTGALAEAYRVLKSLAGSIKPTGALTLAYIGFVAGVLKMLSLLGVGQ